MRNGHGPQQPRPAQGTSPYQKTYTLSYFVNSLLDNLVINSHVANHQNATYYRRPHIHIILVWEVCLQDGNLHGDDLIIVSVGKFAHSSRIALYEGTNRVLF
jgi:hypothetical protein